MNLSKKQDVGGLFMSQLDYKYRVNFVKGTTDKWDEYVKIFDNSPLYEHYFKGTDTLREWVYGPLESGNVIIAETDSGEPVGLMVYDMMGMYGELPYHALLGVKENCRGKGIGDQLIDIYFGICQVMGFDKCFIAVSDFNPRAKALYQKKGFKPLLLVPDLLKKGIAEWLLMKKF